MKNGTRVNFHMSFMEYVNGVRLQEAAFRRAYGISPLKYRTEMIK